MAIELSAAYVSIYPRAVDGFAAKLQAAISGPLEKAAKAAGEKSGDHLAEGVTRKARAAGAKVAKEIAEGAAGGASDIGRRLADPIEAAGRLAGARAGDQLAVAFEGSARSAGVDAGRALTVGVEAGFQAGGVGDELTVPVVAAARRAGARAGDELAEGVGRHAKEAGKKAGRQLDDGVGEGIKDVGRKLAAAFAAVQAGQFLKGAVDAAADTAESVSKLTVLVGDSADELDDWSKTTAEAFGISRREALKAAGTFATFFRGVGKSQQDAAAMSQQLTELAADIASFSNTSPEEAIVALSAALVGESEPIRRYGVLLDDATLKTRAFNLGLIDTTKQVLPPAIRVQAAYAEILAQTGNAQGDFGRTSAGLAGSQKILISQFNDAKAALGEALLPAMSSLVRVARDLLPSVAGLASSFAELAAAAGEAVVPVAGVLASFATSDLGAAAITAAGVAFAIGKITSAAKAAAASLSGMAAANPVLLGLSAAVGAAAAVYLSYKKDAKEAEEQQDRLSKAFLAAADPAFVLVENLTKVVDALEETKKSSGGAADGVEALADPFKVIEELGGGAVSTLSKVGITTGDVAKALREGRIDELIDRFFDSSKKLEGTFESANGAVRYAGGVEDAALALDRLGKSAEDARKENAEAAKGQLESAVFMGVLERATLDAALASSTAADEQGRWLDAAEVLTPELQRIAGSAGGAATGLDGVGDAAGGSVGGLRDAAGASDDLAGAQDLAKDAAAKHEQALKDLGDAIDGFLGKSFDGQEAADRWAEGLSDLTAQVTAQKLDLKVSVSSEAAPEFEAEFEDLVRKAQEEIQRLTDSGSPLAVVAARADELAVGLRQRASDMGIALEDSTVAIEGNSAAALANRDKFRGLVDLAKEDVKRLIDGGKSIEQVTAHANGLAAGLQATAAQLGLSGPAVDGYIAGIRGIGTTAQEANAQLQALPTQLAIDIEATLRLNLDQFREGLLIASAEFKDEMSKAYVASGILEIPGASFALPARASGGPVQAGQAYWVGERGPELLVPDVNGTIVPNHELAMVGATAGGGGRVQVGAINVTEAQSAAQVVDEVNARLGWMLTTRNER